ncbi:hypothetical protein TNIN_263261 [Trichonephila inaurata madagascariensis]|uniref:Uncharacterized protein n=1 Tax=Trichonephila inaurata madagascariensis TaxID=2747483 RepID=A0A8X7CUW2_9ARAC|nr:hypothetical protein TNIN_263261 [Trichonephila inaurata madagascariensis]
MHYFVPLLMHLLCYLLLFLDRIFYSRQIVTNVVTLDAEKLFEYAQSILKVQEWINNVDLEHNLPDFIDEENGDGAVEKLKTQERLTPFKNSTTPSEQNTDHLSDTVNDSLVDTSEKSCFHEKGDTLNFTNADFEMEEPELIQVSYESCDLDDKIIDLREKNHLCTDSEQFVKEMLDNIVEERKSLEVEAVKKIEREDKCLAEQKAFELEKLKLQAQNPPVSVGNSPLGF